MSLALAGAATATAAASGTAHGEPQTDPGAGQVRADVDGLRHAAGAATERHHAARDAADRAERRPDTLADQAARTADAADTARNALGSLATARYRQGAVGPTVRLALSTAPRDALRRAATEERAGARQAGTLRQLRDRLREGDLPRAEARDEAAEVREARRAASRHKRAALEKLSAARRLLAGPGNAGPENTEHPAPPRTAGAPAAPGTAPGPAPGTRAAQAVAYARQALGRPYAWGATGPDAFDCSGLTQAAWRAAGVFLPRTTYTQVDAGRRVARDALAPGDLVFFHENLSHVGLYVGGGRMIHAPRPGATVRVAPVDQMPFAAATRPA